MSMWSDLTSKYIALAQKLQRTAANGLCCALTERLKSVRRKNLLRPDKCQRVVELASEMMWRLFNLERLDLDSRSRLKSEIEHCYPHEDDDAGGFAMDVHLFACVDECFGFVSTSECEQRMNFIIESYFEVIVGFVGLQSKPAAPERRENELFSHPLVEGERCFLDELFEHLAGDVDHPESRARIREWVLQH